MTQATFAEALNILRPELRMRTEQRRALLANTRSALRLLGRTAANLLLPLLPELRGKCTTEVPDYTAAVAAYRAGACVGTCTEARSIRIKWIGRWYIYDGWLGEFYVGRHGDDHYILRKGNRTYKKFIHMQELEICVLPCGLLLVHRNKRLMLMDWYVGTKVELTDITLERLEYANDYAQLDYLLLDDYGETYERLDEYKKTRYLTDFAYV